MSTYGIWYFGSFFLLYNPPPLSPTFLSQLPQVVILLLVADWLVHVVWRIGVDPDNVAIPFLTALGDLLGTGLLTLGFQIMWFLGDRDEDVGE